MHGKDARRGSWHIRLQLAESPEWFSRQWKPVCHAAMRSFKETWHEKKRPRQFGKHRGSTNNTANKYFLIKLSELDQESDRVHHPPVVPSSKNSLRWQLVCKILLKWGRLLKPCVQTSAKSRWKGGTGQRCWKINPQDKLVKARYDFVLPYVSMWLCLTQRRDFNIVPSHF